LTEHESLIVVDFGSQVTQLIARRVRELGVYAEIVPFQHAMKRARELKPRGVILSGGPSSIYDSGAPQLDRELLEIGVPVLGICYGLYTIVAGLGGKVVAATGREYGAATVRVHEAVGPLAPFMAGSDEPVWMSHGDRVHALPPGFRTVGSTTNCEHAAIFDPTRQIWGVQFHPEVAHTPRGGEILRTFIETCGCRSARKGTSSAAYRAASTLRWRR
jgi:GMP synthase (glutamine-hydrolysing)